jgi:hypothetical protein
MPAQGVWGRILQGDALYLRDAAAREQAAWTQSVKPQKLLKLAALFSVFGLPDCAAEILTRYRPLLSPLIDVNSALDMLVIEAGGKGSPAYASYIDAFERDDARFYPTPGALLLKKSKEGPLATIQAIARRIKALF